MYKIDINDVRNELTSEEIDSINELIVIINDINIEFSYLPNVNKNGKPRVYFKCPECYKRCKTLFITSSGIPLCRRCAGYIYPNQHVNKHTAACLAVVRQLSKMGVTGTAKPIEFENYLYDPPPRKYRQHRRTYKKEVEKLYRLIEREHRECIALLERQGLLAEALYHGFISPDLYD